jgi:hypothetical protein
VKGTHDPLEGGVAGALQLAGFMPPLDEVVPLELEWPLEELAVEPPVPPLEELVVCVNPVPPPLLEQPAKAATAMLREPAMRMPTCFMGAP